MLSVDNHDFVVNLEGGGPWGFTLQGGADFRSPLKVGKVTLGGKAHFKGVVAGDKILSINNISTVSLKHHEAQRLIVASRTVLELVCNKSFSILSPKSSTHLRSFDYPSPPRSTTPENIAAKSASLGRHVRQSSLDLQSFRSRSYSDAKKKAAVGEFIAGVKVPAPPPSVKRKSDPVRPEPIPRYVAGIRVPPPPPSTKPARNHVSNQSKITHEVTPVLSSSSSTESAQEDKSLDTNAELQLNILQSNSAQDEPSLTIIDTTGSGDDDARDILTAIQTEFMPSTSESSQTNLSEPADTSSEKDQLDESQSSTSGYKSVNSSSEEDILSSSAGSGSEWYKSMFQSMKRGVEEQLPNKKHVCDRSPIPAKKITLPAEDLQVPTGTGRRSSESSLVASSSRNYNSMTRTSSSGTVDAVNSLHSAVVFRKNMQTYNQSRNYWKTIERQASQERVELAAKRNSIRRTSSSSSTGRVGSPDTLETGTVFDTSFAVFKEEAKTDPSAIKEEVFVPPSNTHASAAETPSENIETVPLKSPSPLARRIPPLRTPSPLTTKTPPLSPEPNITPPPRTPPLRTPSPFITITPPASPEPPEADPVVTTPPKTPPLIVATKTIRTPSPQIVRTPSPQIVRTPSPQTPPLIAPKTIRTPSPQTTVRTPSPQIVRTPSPQTPPLIAPKTIRTPSPQTTVRTPSPQIVRTPSPQIVRTPSPQIVRTPSPQIVRTPSPQTPPLIAPKTIRTPSPQTIVRTPSPQIVRTPSPQTPPLIAPKTIRTPSPQTTVRTPSPQIVRTPSPQTPPLNTAGTPPLDESMSKLHPLLKEGVYDEDKDSTPLQDTSQQDVFTRIDASKLNNALGNAVMLGKMEQEGVGAATLQGVALAVGQQQQEEQLAPRQQKRRSRTSKPPPGEKAMALYNFVSNSEKEISFKKGDIVDLNEQVDANWLKGTVDGRTGIFPISYVKVLTSDEILQLTLEVDPVSAPPLNLLAKAKYDFTAKSPKELSFNKHDIITLLKQIDDNWYEGVLGGDRGIVPVTYVQIFDVQED